jgi:hypothetical protein
LPVCFFFGADLAGLAAALAGFLVADFAPAADAFPADFFAKTLSQFLVNSGLGPERTIGPDITLNSPPIKSKLAATLFPPAPSREISC